MAHFRHDAELVGFPRSLLDDLVRSLLDAAQGVPLTENGLEIGEEAIGDVRLVEGEHLKSGARYRYSPSDDDEFRTDVTVASWDPAGECHVDVRAEYEEHVATARLELRMSGRRLQSVRLSGDYQGPRPLRWLRRAKWHGEADFNEWWAVLGRRTVPISLHVTHPLASMSFLLGRGKDVDERWAGESTLRFGGRMLMRPFVGFGLLVMRRPVRRALEKAFSEAVSEWNKAVPHIVEHGLRERLTFRHEVKLKAVPQEWAEAYAAALHQAVQGLRFENGRISRDAVTIHLLRGEHAEPGARYRVTPVADEDEEEPLNPEEPLTVDERREMLEKLLKQLEQRRRRTLLSEFSAALEAWGLEGRNRVEFRNDDDVRTGWVELDSARRPRTVLAGLDGTAAGYEQLVCEAGLDLERWWAAAAGGSSSEAPALTGSTGHPLGEGSLTATVAPTGDEEWAVDVFATMEGRDWARPLVAAYGMLSHAFIADGFRERAGVAALRWNHAISKGIRMGPEEAAHATLSYLLDDLEFD